MRLRLLTLFALVVVFIVACQGPPPTQYVLVVTATPENTTTTVTPGALSVPEVTTTPTATETPAATPTFDPFPTITVNEVQVAEQRFQNGRMFWLRPSNQIWVMVSDTNDKTRGKWTVYNDTFIDGQPELDPSLTPPASLFQPERGFGKLWRENPEVKQAVGWALEPEFGHVTLYEYHPGGTVNAQNEYVKAPGYHILASLHGETFRFNETDGTWETVK